MSDSIIELLDKLPEDNMTVKVLNARDFVVPGEWINYVGADRTIEAISGQSDANAIMAIRSKAIELYNDGDNGYQRAVWIYNAIDKADVALGTAAMASKVGEKIGLFGFLNKLTPKADTTQSVDLCLKIVAELIAYSKINGITLKPADFVSKITDNYQGAALMRMAALVCVDGLLPLGPDFVQKVQDTLEGDGKKAFESNPVFGSLGQFIPAKDKFGFVGDTFGAVQGWMGNLVGSVGLTPEKVFDSIGSFVEFSDDSLDFVAAFLDQSTDYFRHTGTQSVARSLILRATEEA